jgi:ophiobolin F synthase
MTARMMQAEATKNQDIDISNFITVLGRYYQTQNDFQDITDTALGKISLSEKDDLDQGTFTLTLIHALNQEEKSGRTELIEIMRSRTNDEGLSVEKKARVVELIKEAGSLNYTKSVLDKTHEDLMHEVEVIDKAAGINNKDMRQYLEYLKSLTETAMAV